MLYICENCGKQFIDKFIYTNHLNRKTPCSKENIEKLKNKSYECESCNKKFINKQTLLRHMENYCKGYNKEIEKIIENKESFEIALNNLNNNNIKNYKDLIITNKIIKNDNIKIIENNQINKPIIKNTSSQKEVKKLNGFIYILKEREFIKTNENIYKIGKTSKDNVIDRFKQYPNLSKLYGSWKISNVDEFEKLLKSAFKLKFNNKNEIGTEYYEGNIEEMIKSINYLYQEYNI
jgi:DNA-directed RNA polymerase subunit RPC12/RpoP